MRIITMINNSEVHVLYMMIFFHSVPVSSSMCLLEQVPGLWLKREAHL